MHSVNDGNEGQQAVALLNNLKEDLQVLENSWNSEKPHRKKIFKHFIAIVDSILGIARAESLEPFELACAEVRYFLASVAKGKADLEESSWTLTSELMDLLHDSLREGAVPVAGLEEWQSRWRGEPVSHSLAKQQPGGGSNHSVSPSQVARGNAESLAQEKDEMVETEKFDPEELLREAQKALSSGNGENAKELALKAAEQIARREAEEEKKKKQKLLSTDLEMAIHVESEIGETIKHLQEETAKKDQELTALQNRLSEAQTSFEERERECQETKEQIDKTEAELASLKDRHQHLLDRFQETLPARDAAERECSKLKTEFEKLGSEVSALRHSLNDTEDKYAHARKKKEEIETELETLIE
ncbi:MAG: hypothetical protein JSV16_10285 [Candidatus Hydrogenedentota bacterium]|nr:MAG: hypothetical protein JSV16_10285 [Candidatus Hydrogenedentota bacterium]